MSQTCSQTRPETDNASRPPAARRWPSQQPGLYHSGWNRNYCDKHRQRFFHSNPISGFTFYSESVQNFKIVQKSSPPVCLSTILTGQFDIQPFLHILDHTNLIISESSSSGDDKDKVPYSVLFHILRCLVYLILLVFTTTSSLSCSPFQEPA